MYIYVYILERKKEMQLFIIDMLFVYKKTIQEYRLPTVISKWIRKFPRKKSIIFLFTNRICNS